MGWVIDRYGGLRVVVVYWGLSIACAIGVLQVLSREGLTLLVLAHTVVFPLYGAADIRVYRSSAAREIGSITSTHSFFRNLYRGFFLLFPGWTINRAGHNYRLGFAVGIAAMSPGMIFFLVYHLKMRSGPVSATRDGTPASPILS